MNIIQKLKFIFARHDGAPTEVRPDDMTSKADVEEKGACCKGGVCKMNDVVKGKEGDSCCGEDHDCDCA